MDDKKIRFGANPPENVDTGYGDVEDVQEFHETSKSDRSLMWKIDLRLMPLMYARQIRLLHTVPLLTKFSCITYMLQSIDKTTLGYAAVFGLKEDAHLRGSEYSWLGALFYLGYLAWEYPTGILLQKLPIAKFMSATVRSLRLNGGRALTGMQVILWGVVLMCHAAADDFAGLAAARTFLGVFEASINPGTMLLFSMWYKRIEQPLRLGIWVGSAGIGYVRSLSFEAFT